MSKPVQVPTPINHQSKTSYTMEMENPITHRVKIIIRGELPAPAKGKEKTFVWHSAAARPLLIEQFCAQTALGERLMHRQVSSEIFSIDVTQTVQGQALRSREFIISYFVYTVSDFSSHLNSRGAFFIGQQLFLHQHSDAAGPVTLALHFPPLWSKISCALKDLSERREDFLYEAKNIAELLQTPLAFGCYETDGLLQEPNKIPTYLNFCRGHFPESFSRDLKKKLTAFTKLMNQVGQSEKKSLPFSHYSFFLFLFPAEFSQENISHGARSSAFSFFPAAVVAHLSEKKVATKKYLERWMVQLAQNYTASFFSLSPTHPQWFSLGLAQFFGRWSLAQLEIINRETYLRGVEREVKRIMRHPGNKFATLEDSLQAWPWPWQEGRAGRLKRDRWEFFVNSLVDPWGRSEVAFFLLRLFLQKADRSLAEWTLAARSLSDHSQINTNSNLNLNLNSNENTNEKESENWIGDWCADWLRPDDFAIWETFIRTTEDVDWVKILQTIGVNTKIVSSAEPWWGFYWEMREKRLFVVAVERGSPAAQAGLSRGDEIISVQNKKASALTAKKWNEILQKEQSPLELDIIREGDESEILSFELRSQKGPIQLSPWVISDKNKWQKFWQIGL